MNFTTVTFTTSLLKTFRRGGIFVTLLVVFNSLNWKSLQTFPWFSNVVRSLTNKSFYRLRVIHVSQNTVKLNRIRLGEMEEVEMSSIFYLLGVSVTFRFRNISDLSRFVPTSKKLRGKGLLILINWKDLQGTFWDEFSNRNILDEVFSRLRLSEKETS